ncbi:MAG: SgcJ/EcaC family oxidoreductase [Proteobacteria bacterium]|nr:SgcJ/EcaC family oxidoreductase [Pseudomonadota bacterium]
MSDHPPHPLPQQAPPDAQAPSPPLSLPEVIAAADRAITDEDFDAVMAFYTEDATLVVKPGLNATGKEQIRRAMEAIAAHFNHSLVVTQGEMVVVEGGDTALVLAETMLDWTQADGTLASATRHATYVFRRQDDGSWLCAVDNSYGTDLVAPQAMPEAAA